MRSRASTPTDSAMASRRLIRDFRSTPPDFLEHPVSDLAELGQRLAGDLIPWHWERNRDLQSHRSRRGIEHHHPASEIDRFVDVVGDEDHGQAVLGPDS